MYHDSEGIDSTRSVEPEQRTLNELMGKLVSIPDVSGAAILRTDGSLVSWKTKSGEKPNEYIDFVNKSLSAAYKSNIHYYNEGLFNESVIDYNGHKILMSRIMEDVMLLLLLNKKAYLGLTMLDVEGCLREIDGALSKKFLKINKTPD